MEETYAIWAVVLFAVAVLLFVLELLIPSGGLLGLGSAAAAIGGVVMLFRIDTAYGFVGAFLCLLAIPFMAVFALRALPHTPVWRALTLQSETPPQPTIGGPPPAANPLIGAEGKALTDLRPIGACLIDGKRMDCLASGGTIEAGARVKVIAADGIQTKVRAIET